MKDSNKLNKQFTVFLSDWDNENQFTYFVDAEDTVQAAEIAINNAKHESPAELKARFIVNGFHKNIVNGSKDSKATDGEYFVTWNIDVCADDSIGAARKAHKLARAHNSSACVYDVKSPCGSVTRVDLAESR